MRSGIIILLLVLLASSVSAAPSINGIIGDTSNGGTATVSGSQFGTNPSVNRIWWLGGSDGWIENQIPNTPVKTNMPPDSMYVYSGQGDDDRYTNTQAWSGSKSMALNSVPEIFDGTSSWESTFSYKDPQGFNKALLTLWYKADYTRIQTDLNPQHKFIYFTAMDPTGTFNSNCQISADPLRSNNMAIQWAYVFHPGTTTPSQFPAVNSGTYLSCGPIVVDGREYYEDVRALYYGNHGIYPTPGIASGLLGVTLPTSGTEGSASVAPNAFQDYWYADEEWVKLTIMFDAGSPTSGTRPPAGDFDGSFKVLLTRLPGSPNPGTHVIADIQNANFKWMGDTGSGLMADNSCLRCNVFPHNLVTFYHLFSNTVNSASSANFYHDDIFIQPDSFARIELGNDPDYYASTKLETQIPISWDASGIQFEVNYGGSFNPGDTAYLFVVDDNGVASAGYPVQLGTAPDSLIYYNSMSDVNTLWHPEVSVADYPTQGGAVKNTGLTYVSSLYGSGTRFGNIPIWNGDFWVKGENFDFFDTAQDGGRVDLILRWDQNPQGPDSNTWIGFDPYSANGGRNVNFEMTSSNPRYPMLMFGSSDPYDRTTYNQFRANVLSHPSWLAVNQGEWHTYSYLWRNNGGLHKDQAHVFIDGVLVSSDFSGNLPNVDELTDFAFGASTGGQIAFTLDEVYSFDSWDVSGSTGNFADLVWPEGVLLHYPMQTTGPQWGEPVTHTNMPEYQWQVQNDLSSTTSCNLYVDNNFVQSVNNIQNVEHVEVIPNLPLSNGDHTWYVACDGGRLVSPTYTFAVNFATPTEPTLYPVTGTMDNGATVSVSGALLGVGPDSVEWTGDWIESQTPGVTINSKQGWDRSQIPNFDNAVISQNRAFSGSKSIDAAPYTSYEVPFLYTSPSNFYEVYFTYWEYMDITALNGVDITQWKEWRVNGDLLAPDLVLQDHTGSVYRFGTWFGNGDLREFTTSNWCVLGCSVSHDTNADGYMTTADCYPSGTDLPVPASNMQPEGQWVRMEVHLKGSTPDQYDGSIWTAKNVPGQTKVVTFDRPDARLFTNYNDCRNPNPNYWKRVIFQNAFFNNVDNVPFMELNYDDIYIQTGSQARLELCNNITYASATVCEVQVVNPSSWTDTSISFQSNFGGSFSSGETAYLFVVTDDGTVTNGVPVTLGSGSSSATCFDGIQNQGETGVDCGGTCPACSVEPTCFDGILNQDEVHTDCGGSVCSACTCYEPSSLLGCTTVAGCAGEQLCVDGEYDVLCTDAYPGDGCPAIGDTLVLQNGLNIVGLGTYTGQSEARIASGWNCDVCDVIQPVNGHIRNPSGSYVFKKLYHFDTSMIDSGKQVFSAILELNEFNSFGGLSDVSASRVLKPWDTYATYRCSSDPEQDGCAGDVLWSDLGLGLGGVTSADKVLVDTVGVIDGWNSFDVTDAVQYWIDNPSQNFGFILEELDGASNQDFHTGTEGVLGPKLTIIFSASSSDPYDLDGNSIVDILDLYELILNFGSSTTQGNYVASRDYNSDDKINIQDLVIHLQHWG